MVVRTLRKNVKHIPGVDQPGPMGNWFAFFGILSQTKYCLLLPGTLEQPLRCQGFELERLLRKMLLRMLSGMLPVTLVPALHVAGTAIVERTQSNMEEHH